MPKEKKSSNTLGSSTTKIVESGKERHKSCQGCRSRKMKCSRQYPCSNCLVRDEECVWIGKNAPTKSSESNLSQELESAKEQTRKLRQVLDMLLPRVMDLEQQRAGSSISSENESVDFERMLDTFIENDGVTSMNDDGLREFSRGSSSSLSSLREFNPIFPTFLNPDSTTTNSLVHSPSTLSPTFGNFDPNTQYHSYQSQPFLSNQRMISSPTFPSPYHPHSIPTYSNYSEPIPRNMLELYQSDMIVNHSLNQQDPPFSQRVPFPIRYLDHSNLEFSNFPSTSSNSHLYPPLSLPPHQDRSQIVSTLQSSPTFSQFTSHLLPHTTSGEVSRGPVSIESQQTLVGEFESRYDYALSLRSTTEGVGGVHKSTSPVLNGGGLM